MFSSSATVNLQEAVPKRNHEEVVRALQGKADPNTCVPWGFKYGVMWCSKAPVLLVATYQNDSATVRALCEAGADTELKGDYPWVTALYLAALYGYHQITEILLQYGAGTKARDRWGWQPIHEAAEGGHNSTTVMANHLKASSTSARIEINTPALMEIFDMSHISLPDTASSNNMDTAMVLLDNQELETNSMNPTNSYEPTNPNKVSSGKRKGKPSIKVMANKYNQENNDPQAGPSSQAKVIRGRGYGNCTTKWKQIKKTKLSITQEREGSNVMSEETDSEGTSTSDDDNNQQGTEEQPRGKGKGKFRKGAKLSQKMRAMINNMPPVEVENESDDENVKYYSASRG